MPKHYLLKDFLPLIVILSTITLGSFVWNFFEGGDGMRLMEIFMGLFFVVFAVLKISNLKAFAKAYALYDLLAMRYGWYGYAYPFLELLLGAFYLLSLFPLYTNLVTAVVMTVSALGVYLKLREGEQIMCACLGAVFKLPMTWVTLLEDVIMALMAIWMLVRVI